MNDVIRHFDRAQGGMVSAETVRYVATDLRRPRNGIGAMTRLRAMLLAVLVVSGLVGGLAAEPKAAEAATNYANYSASYTNSIFWKVSLNTQVALAGGTRVDWKYGSCETAYARGGTIKYSWKGTYRDPLNRWLEVGCNFYAHAIVKGFPLSGGFWLRLRIYNNGSSQAFGGRL